MNDSFCGFINDAKVFACLTSDYSKYGKVSSPYDLILSTYNKNTIQDLKNIFSKIAWSDISYNINETDSLSGTYLSQYLMLGSVEKLEEKNNKVISHLLSNGISSDELAEYGLEPCLPGENEDEDITVIENNIKKLKLENHTHIFRDGQIQVAYLIDLDKDCFTLFNLSTGEKKEIFR